MLLMMNRRQVAVGHEDRIARMIVPSVKRLEIVVTEVRNVLGIASRVVVIGDGRKQRRLQTLVQRAQRRAHGTLHLVVNHPFVNQITAPIARLGELDPMTLLSKVEGVELREKDRIQIYRQEVVEVFHVAAGEGVGGPVAGGEGIHERVERPANHHEERIAHREALTTT